MSKVVHPAQKRLPPPRPIKASNNSHSVVRKPTVPNSHKSHTSNKIITIPPSDLDNILESVKKVHLILSFYGLNDDTANKSLKKTADQWFSLKGEKSWIAVVKWKLAAFRAYHVGSDLTKRILPPWGTLEGPTLEKESKHLLCGGAGRWLNEHLAPSQPFPKRHSILSSLAQSKKAMPKPGEGLRSIAIADTKQTLTTHYPIDPFTWKRKFYIDNPDKIRIPLSGSTTYDEEVLGVRIKEVVDEILGDNKMLYTEMSLSAFPSTSSNYINSRKKGGSVAVVMDELDLLGLRSEAKLVKIHTCTESEDPVVEEEIEEEEKKKEEELLFGEGYYIDDTCLEKQYEQFWDSLLVKALEETPSLDFVALPEALKVRVITKQAPLTQVVLRGVWKYIYNKMKRIRCFKLIGEELSEEHLERVFGSKKFLNDDEWYLSGDYSDATNKLKSAMTRKTVECISERLFEGEMRSHMRLLMEKCLVDQEIEINGTAIPQRNGQTMGSIMSFIILCIINATITREAICYGYREPTPLGRVAMTINGDDVLCRIKEDNMGLWAKLGEAVGLKESLGKTFKSKEFVEMNSRTYRVPSKEFPWFVNIKFINAGLLIGLSKGGESEEATRITSLGDKVLELLQDAPEGMQEELYSTFLKYHRDLLDKLKVPWFMPKWIGGLGLPILPGTKFVPSDLDLRLAREILIGWYKKSPEMLSANDAEDAVSWVLQRVIDKNYNSVHCYSTDNPRDEGVIFLSKLRSKQALSLLFLKDVSMNDIRKESDGKRFWKALKHNTSLWRPKTHSSGLLSKPLDLSQLVAVKRYEGIHRIGESEVTGLGPIRVLDVVPIVVNNYVMERVDGAIIEEEKKEL